MDWLKLNSRGILRGSLSNTSNTTQLIWIKLLAMANETRNRDGYLRYKEGNPYPLSYIAATCNVTEGELTTAIDEFIDDVRDEMPRVQFTQDGSLRINNWAKYQNEPPDKEAPPRLKSAIEREAIAFRSANQFPEIARDALSGCHGDNIVSRQGEIIRENGEVKFYQKTP